MSSLLQPGGISSPTPSNASSTAGHKRKRPLPAAQQDPQFREVHDWRTHMHFAVEFLKLENKAYTFDEIINYLSLQHDAEKRNKVYNGLTKGNPLVQLEKGPKGQLLYRFKPKHNVRSADQLRTYLSKRTDARGIAVKDLKEGWPEAIEEINRLEKEGHILVVRHKKPPQDPKTVWHNDASLKTETDSPFKEMWHKIPLPANPDELRQKLEAAGIKPTSAPKEVVKAKQKEKKKKGPRKSGKTTNAHMVGILRDYSHKRK
jgi:transcription initiation factor TFIIE subunit beta